MRCRFSIWRRHAERVAAPESPRKSGRRGFRAAASAGFLVSFLAAQQIACDHELLDLAGAFIDAENSDVAVEAFDAVIRDIACPAEDLHRAVGDAPYRFGGEIFGAGRFHGDALARVALFRGIEHHAAGGIGFRLAIGEHALDQLEIADALAELLALARIGDAFADQPLGDADADAGDMQPPAVEHLHRHLEAFAFRAEPQACRHARILEDHVADVGALLAHLPFRLADRHARRV